MYECAVSGQLLDLRERGLSAGGGWRRQEVFIFRLVPSMACKFVQCLCECGIACLRAMVCDDEVKAEAVFVFRLGIEEFARTCLCSSLRLRAKKNEKLFIDLKETKQRVFVVTVGIGISGASARRERYTNRTCLKERRYELKV